MKYLGIVFTMIFLLFAGWQYNDPDPVLWIPIYLVAAYCSLKAYQGKSNPELLVVVTIMSFVAGLNTWFQMTSWEGFFSEGGGLSMKTINQELAREACGLWICTFSFLLYLGMNFFQPKAK
ncbi:transmembrane 220 family protein [Arcicella aquatica]|uniref:Transmembrane 220 family protein n=1 Tax=Arcicella aquatica TaxID=217141 RepID=A0ABU5QJ61_9BACT|nr:transmembrane 220 family protein [Arcicella aquatica]MEA5256810.1 transmembrane 220 family protein [Arcicella aquatica]